MKLFDYLRRHPILAFLLLCVIPATGFAQLTTGDVLGTVDDASGAVVPNADVVLQSVDTAAERHVFTDAHGAFLFSALQPGDYRLRVTVPGFNTSQTSAFHLGAGDRVRPVLMLTVGRQESVDVNAVAQALQTDTSTLETSITSQQAEELPLNGRNFEQLAQLSVGVNEGNENALGSGQRPDDRRQTSALTANAQSDTLNQELVDGIDNNEGSIGTIGVRPSVDAIAEFHVLTGNYPAEAGKTAGAVVNVITRAGTNRLHGSLYEFARNSIFDGRDFFAKASLGPKPTFELNQFGGSVGGPIWRDHTFFFGSYEGFRQLRSTTYNNTVPTAFEQDHPGDFSDAGGPVLTPNPVSLRFFALYPHPNNGASTFTYSPTGSQNSDVYDARVDHHFNDRNQIFARYAHNQVNTFTPGTLPAVNGIEPGGSATFPGPSFQRAQQFAMDYLHIVSPQTLFELKAGFTHLLNRTLPLTYGQPLGNEFGIVGSNYNVFSTMMPFVNITGFAGFGGADSLPLFNGTNTFQYSGSFTHTAGRHNLKAGAIFLRRQIFNQQNAAANAAGSFAFNGQFSLTAYPTTPTSLAPEVDFLSGHAFTTRRIAQLYPRYLRDFEPSLYVQDDWRASDKLTFNLGLRWDMYTPLKERFGHISMFSTDTNAIAVSNANSSDTLGVHTDYTSVAPRFGFAYNVRPSTVVRGAFGLTFFRDDNGPSVPFADPPFTYVDTPSPLSTLISDALPVPSPQSITNLTGAARGVDPHYRNAYAEQFHLDVEQRVQGTVFTVSYVGQLAHRLKIAPDLNLAAPETNNTNTNDFQTRRPFFAQYPNLNSSINIFMSEGFSNYHALQATAVHPYSHGLTAQVNYTYAHALGDTQAFSESVLFASVDNAHFAQREYSNSDLDQRHRITMLLNYQLPFGAQFTGVRRTLLHGWQVNAIDVWGTGEPFTVTNSTARTNTGATSDRPNLTGQSLYPAVQRTGIASTAHWINPNAFAPQPFGTIGNVARTNVYGPHFRHFDASLFKDFAMPRNMNLQLRAEAFNVTNTPSFGTPNGVLGSATFGQVNATRLGSNPRQLQFAARLSF